MTLVDKEFNNFSGFRRQSYQQMTLVDKEFNNFSGFRRQSYQQMTLVDKEFNNFSGFRRQSLTSLQCGLYSSYMLPPGGLALDFKSLSTSVVC